MEQSGFLSREKREFRDVVLAHTQKILDISCREFSPDCKREVYQGNKLVDIIKEDNRKNFVQSVSTLASILVPYFDSEMQKEYDKHIDIMELSFFEVHKTKYFEEITKKYLKEENVQEIDAFVLENVFVEEQLERARKLFKALNLLMKRQDYLKGVVFGETGEEVVEDEED